MNTHSLLKYRALLPHLLLPMTWAIAGQAVAATGGNEGFPVSPDQVPPLDSPTQLQAPVARASATQASATQAPVAQASATQASIATAEFSDESAGVVVPVVEVAIAEPAFTPPSLPRSRDQGDSRVPAVEAVPAAAESVAIAVPTAPESAPLAPGFAGFAEVSEPLRSPAEVLLTAAAGSEPEVAATAERVAPEVTSPEVTSPEVTAPAMVAFAPRSSSAALASPALASPALASPALGSPAIDQTAPIDQTAAAISVSAADLLQPQGLAVALVQPEIPAAEFSPTVDRALTPARSSIAMAQGRASAAPQSAAAHPLTFAVTEKPIPELAILIDRPLRLAQATLSQSNTPSNLPPTTTTPAPITPEIPATVPPIIPFGTPLPETIQTPQFSQPIAVRTVQVTGSTVFGAERLAAIAKPYEGRTVRPEELQQLADEITQLYLNEGYLTSRAIVAAPPQNGTVTVQVVEGRLGQIQIEGTERLNPSYIRSRIRLGAGTPLNANRLEDQLRLLRADPLFDSFEASLRPEGPGVSSLVVRVDERQRVAVGLNADNYSPPSIGSERFGVDLRFRNLTGLGDQLLASYYRSITGGANQVDFAYQVPINPMNGTILLRVSPNFNTITQAPFDAFNIESNRAQYELTYRQPIIRTPNEEFALSLGFVHQSGQTFVFDQPTPFGIGPDRDGVSRTSVVQFAQDYVRRDRRGAWGARSQFNFGIDALDATINDDPIPDGRFFSWLGQVQRAQQLDNNNLLLIQAELQLTPDSLLPAHQFVIGGGQSVRGYRQNVRSGDNGFRVSIENRIALERDRSGVPVIQLAPFVDLGKVWNQGDNPNTLPDQTFLVGAGLGVLFDNMFGVPGLSSRLDYGLPIVNLDDRGNNIQDDGLYFSLRYQF